MKHKLFIIFALVLVFGAMMAFSVSAETSSFVIFEEAAADAVLDPSSSDVTNISKDLTLNHVYRPDMDYISSVSQPEITFSAGAFYDFNFKLENFQPDHPTRQNWFVFLENDYVLSKEGDMLLSVGFSNKQGEGFYTYGEDYQAYVLVSSRDNNYRYTVTLSKPKGGVNVVVPKGYEAVVYLVVKANKPVGKSLDVSLTMSTVSVLDVNWELPVCGLNPFTIGLSDLHMQNIPVYELAYSEGFSGGQEYCKETHADLIDAAMKEGKSLFETFANFFFEKKTVNGEPQYSGILGGIFQAYLDVANGISLFGISLHTVLLTLLTLVVLGVGIKFVLSVI